MLSLRVFFFLTHCVCLNTLCLSFFFLTHCVCLSFFLASPPVLMSLGVYCVFFCFVFQLIHVRRNVCVCARVCSRACVFTRVHARTYTCAHTHAHFTRELPRCTILNVCMCMHACMPKKKMCACAWIWARASRNNVCM